MKWQTKESGIAQTNTVKIYTAESFEEFAKEIKRTTPDFLKPNQIRMLH